MKRVFFGDYTNLSVYNNIVRPIWSALSGSSTKTIYTTLIDSVYANTITWVGETSNEWNNPWNWSPRQIPGQVQDVIIPAITSPKFNPTISASGFSCNNLTISPDASLTIPEGIVFTVNGNLILEK
jgi:hypothetical protein